MKKILFFCLFAASFLSGEERIAQANGLEIWTDTFGQKENPAILLIHGARCQGILWAEDFCEALAAKGYYLIRYDHRDTGLSSCIDYERDPYDLFDMAKDAVGILDDYGIERASVVGISMGGPIAELMAARFPTRIQSATLIATSCDFRPLLSVFGGSGEKGSLSPPKADYISWLWKVLFQPPSPELQLEGWRICNGSQVPFATELALKKQTEVIRRSLHPEKAKNHLPAMLRSEYLIRMAPHQILAPTVVIQGTEDPIFPPDHGECLAGAIAGAKYVLVQGMGHILNPQFYDLVIDEISSVIGR